MIYILCSNCHSDEIFRADQVKEKDFYCKNCDHTFNLHEEKEIIFEETN